MNGYKFIFLFLLFTSSIFADTVIDSLIVDSLTTHNTKIEANTTSVSSDTLLSYLKPVVNKYISHKKNPFKKDINSISGISEGFNIYIPELYRQHYELNDFTLQQNNFSNSLFQLLYHPFYNISDSLSLMDFKQVKYSLPIPISTSYAGIGSTDTNYAFLSFYKGLILNRLDINFAYLGDESSWNLTNNKSKNFHIFSAFKVPFVLISYSNDFFDRRIPNFFITSQSDSFKTIPIKLNSQEIHLDSKIAEIALKTSKISYADTTSHTYQAFAKKKINYIFGYLEPKYEIIKTDSLISFISLKTQFKYLNIDMKAYFKYLYGENFYFSSYNKYNVTSHYSVMVKYLSEKIYDRYNKIYLGGKIANLGVDIFFGKTFGNNFKTLFSELTQDKKFWHNNLSLDIKNNFIFNKKSNKQNPFLEFASTFELSYHLHYDNSIQIGLEYNMLSFDRDMHIYDLFLNGYIGMNITKYFQLQLDFINLTNEYSYYMLSQDTFHINIGFNWIFFN